MESKQLPLVTFAVIAYNQEQYIREAIEGAFAQTYSPLEIILSDDCSPDRTFAIMQEMAEAYDGPHTIVLNRNDPNLGIGAHVEKVGRMSRGELVVMAAGDDISLPERTATLAEMWQNSGGQAVCLGSGYKEMDMEGGILERKSQTWFPDFSLPVDEFARLNPFVTGATSAYSRQVFDAFPAMLDGVVHEDVALVFRVKLLGGVGVYKDDSLVLYRQGGISRVGKSNKEDPLGESMLVARGRKIMDYKQKLEDAKALLSTEEYVSMKRVCSIEINELRMRIHSVDPKVSLLSLMKLCDGACSYSSLVLALRLKLRNIWFLLKP